MPKVFGLHEVELPAGLTPEEFEEGLGKQPASLPEYEGWKTYLLKGDRGERAGKSWCCSRWRALSRVIGITRARVRSPMKSVGSTSNIPKRQRSGTSTGLCSNLTLRPTIS
jgi:hypothetical protein